jgi:beta-phosphoglucomutase
LLDFSSEHGIVFEDSFAGVEVPRNAGYKVVGVTTTHTREEFIGTDLVIDDFKGLLLINLEKLLNNDMNRL